MIWRVFPRVGQATDKEANDDSYETTRKSHKLGLPKARVLAPTLDAAFWEITTLASGVREGRFPLRVSKYG